MVLPVFLARMELLEKDPVLQVLQDRTPSFMTESCQFLLNVPALHPPAPQVHRDLQDKTANQVLLD